MEFLVNVQNCLAFVLQCDKDLSSVVIIGVTTDITFLKQSVDRNRKASRSDTEFLGDGSHRRLRQFLHGFEDMDFGHRKFDAFFFQGFTFYCQNPVKRLDQKFVDQIFCFRHGYSSFSM